MTKKAVTPQGGGQMHRDFPDAPWTNVLIPLDKTQTNDGYQYVEIGLNGRMYTVLRGVQVEIPVPLYLELHNSGRYQLSA
jgi:hypothetical protein